jgi:hypothetical protein
MLRYFLNFDPELGAKEAEASLASRNSTGCYRFLFQQLGDELPQVEPLAIGALNDADLEVANDAALALGRWGTAAAEKTLWARLERFHEEWRGREGDLRSEALPGPGLPGHSAGRHLGELHCHRYQLALRT